MQPRSLRHRLEKAAKILVTIQKHLPKAECTFDSDKGAHGHIQIDFVSQGFEPAKWKSLGQELESKGYQFTEKYLPWIGQISYKGNAEERPSVVMTLPHAQDRMGINQESPVKPYSFL